VAGSGEQRANPVSRRPSLASGRNGGAELASGGAARGWALRPMGGLAGLVHGFLIFFI
jgi:hypothetical protein